MAKKIKLAKIKYERKITKRSKNNRKLFYAYIATKNKKSSGKKIGPLKKIRSDGIKEIIKDDHEVASLLNEYFVSVFNRAVITETQNNTEVIRSQNVMIGRIKFTELEERVTGVDVYNKFLNNV